jgi:pimeloyl-ACP methyl ester carboxylesterase
MRAKPVLSFVESGTPTALALLLLLVSSLAFAQADYAREKRWADEIVPAILVGDPVQLEIPSGRKVLGIYAPARAGVPGLVIVHGLGVHPDWNLINVLRSQLAEQGYATLSVQMPVLASHVTAEGYGPVFPEAAERLAAAVRFLRGKGHGKVAIVSHSLGARMANHFLEHAAAPGVDAWVSIGITSLYTGISRVKVPVLDIYGERDFPAVRDNAQARAESLRRVRGSAQVQIAGADHFFVGQEAELIRNVKLFLDQKLR